MATNNPYNQQPNQGTFAGNYDQAEEQQGFISGKQVDYNDPSYGDRVIERPMSVVARDFFWEWIWNIKFLFLLLVVIFKTMEPILVAHSKDGDTFPYNTTTVVMFMEIIKLTFSLCFLTGEFIYFYKNGPPDAPGTQVTVSELLANPRFSVNWKDNLHFMVPGIVYAANNNMQYAILLYVTPATFQLLMNLQVITTAVLMRVFFRKLSTEVQWAALWVLFIGAVVSQLKCPKAGEDKSYFESSAFWGVLFTIINCAIASLGGVYTEWRFKANKECSINLQNAQLYIYGIFINIIVILIKDADALSPERVTSGYDGRTVAVLLVSALVGLSISVVLKRLTNIAYVFAKQISMLCTVIASAIFLAATSDVSVNFFVAMFTIFIAIYLYYGTGQQKIADERTAAFQKLKQQEEY